MCTSLRVCVMPKKTFCTCKNHILVSSSTLNNDHDNGACDNNTCTLIEAIFCYLHHCMVVGMCLDMHIATHPYPCLTAYNATAGSLWEFVGVSAPNGYKVTLSCHAIKGYIPLGRPHTNILHKHYTGSLSLNK